MRKQAATKYMIVGIFIGLIVTWQFKATVPITSSFPTDEIEAKKVLLKDFLDEQKYLQSRIVFLRDEITKSHSKVESISQESNISVLDELKNNVGLFKVSGSGLEIELDDGRSAVRDKINISDDKLIQASDIRDIVNLVNASRPLGISVNGHRIIATSTISSVGNTVLVNNSYIAPPFTINVVGDIDILLQRLLNKQLLSAIYKRQSKGDIVFKIRPKDFIVVPTYNGDLRTSHITLVE